MPVVISRILPYVAVLFLFFFIYHEPASAQYDNNKYSLINKIVRTPSMLTTATALPSMTQTIHANGNMELILGNNGILGQGGASDPIRDPLTGEQYSGWCAYPKGSDIVVMFMAGLWVGAVVGRDTLVSTVSEDYYYNTEFWPEVAPLGDFYYESIDIGSPLYSDDAYSELDAFCQYTDTLVHPSLTGLDIVEGRPHIPLGLKVSQRSMSWSYAYADDFVLFDLDVQNIGRKELKEVYMAIWMDVDVADINTDDEGQMWTDDIVGFYRTHPSSDGCGFIDTVNIAWCADNDGDPENGAWDDKSARSIVGAKVLKTPSDSLKYTYNWWITNYDYPNLDWGPRKKSTPNDPFRSFGASLGTPIGDRNKYYIMRHQEFDYDLMYTALDHSDEGWLPPPEYAERISQGYDIRYLLSFGPFDISPGQKLPIAWALVGDETFHVNPNDFEQYFNPNKPDVYYDHLNFSGFADNAKWATWIYDNPGVDTDGDGYFGKYHVCNYDSVLIEVDTVMNGRDTTITIYRYTMADTLYYEGDGVPDFRGASPPPAPYVRVEPSVGTLKVRFNGLRSETTPDRFSGVLDFEGYRAYIGRDNLANSYSMVTSYDIEDYYKYFYDANDLPEPSWIPSNAPFSREDLACLYGDSCSDPDFDPEQYTRYNPLVHPLFPDSLFYFRAQDFNNSEFGISTDIRKTYPDQPYPSSLLPSEADPDELTEDGLFKYFEYEVTIDDLLPTVPYYVNVTAFDFGCLASGIQAMESPVVSKPVLVYPLTAAEEVEQNKLQAYVYPNPYRIDGGYAASGYENRGTDKAVERARLIHFANLPKVCKIYIYSLDGDLVRELEHNYPEGGPEAMHDTWDLITRNTQATVSGLYYWVVEAENGDTQVGKLVIIK